MHHCFTGTDTELAAESGTPQAGPVHPSLQKHLSPSGQNPRPRASPQPPGHACQALLRGKVLLAGEQMTAAGDGEEEGGSDMQLRPPAHWRLYKTPAGHDYYYDPATERVHYLSATRFNNHAIAPSRNVSVTYDTLAELEAKLSGVPEHPEDEAELREARPPPDASRAVREAWIRRKYADKAFSGARPQAGAGGGAHGAPFYAVLGRSAEVRGQTEAGAAARQQPRSGICDVV